VLACPNCSLALDVTELGATCANRHSFDRGRGGYLNLLLGGRLSSDAVPGDTGESLSARRRFLTAGNYAPIARELAAATAGAPGPVLDVGCGEGWYLTQVEGDRYGLDVSKAAVQMAARAHPDTMFVVGNAYRLPVLDASVGVVISVFAPHPFDEFARVLRPEGWWVTVTPGPLHLQEMKPDLSDRERVSERMKRRSEPPMEAVSSTRVQYAVQLTEESAADLYLMTPLRFQKDAGPQGLREVTVDVWVSSSRTQ
jgi:23S rRNA (guanine745-N1)-methyltransferase